jgi:hypothetical protein
VSAPAEAPPLRPTRTRVRLIRTLVVLLATTLVVLATSLWAVRRVLDTARTVRDRTSVAVLEVAAARAALTDADLAANQVFRMGQANPGQISATGFTWPSQDFTNDLAGANQSLAKVAEANQAGAAGTGILQVVAELVTAYSSAVERADVHFRQPGSELLVVADLWSASRLLRGPDGALAQLASLQRLQRAALDEQLEDGMSPALLPLWLLVPVTSVVLLAGTQWYLWRRFRRRFNLPLVGATVLTAGVGVTLAVALGLQLRLDDVRTRIDTVLADRQSRIAAADVAGQTELVALVARHCGPSSSCGSTVAAFAARPRFVEHPADEARIAAGSDAVLARAGDAADSHGIEYLIPAFSIAALGLIAWGLSPRLDEYRYRA